MKIFVSRAFYAISFVALILFGSRANAQQLADKIVAVIGKSKIILNSDLEIQEAQMRKQYPDFNDSMKCLLLREMILQKLMVEQAERDSVSVSDEEVEAKIDNKVRYFMQAYGGREALETAAGKTIYQLKDDYREFTKDELLAERMRNDIISGLKVTPVEVRAFFDEAAKDTLPFFPGTVEVGQVVIDPPVNAELDKYAKDKITELRNDIVNNGKSFEAMAGLYSEDPGSRDNGGDLGVITRDQVVPEFAAAAYKLKDGEISPIVKSKFGYHIILMVNRQGEGAQVKHILIKPQHTGDDYAKTIVQLDSLRSAIIAGKTTFAEAVGKFSTDEQTKMSGGLITSQQTGSTNLQIDELDPILATMIDTLQVGSYSVPHIYINAQTGERSTRIVYLRNRTEPHQANLKDDYNQIMEMALERKKAQKLDSWINEKLPTFYIRVAEEYARCPALSNWNVASRK